MNMDYSEAFELLRQDAEKERNRKADKAVHDNLYNKEFHDGLAVLDRVRAEIENDWQLKKYPSSPFSCGLRRAIEIIDKYKAEKEEENVSL